MNRRIYLPMTKLVLALMATCMAVSMSSCAADAYDEKGADADGHIDFNTNIEELGSPARTRGSLTTLATLDSYGVSAGVHDAETTYAEGECGNYFRDLQVFTANGETTYMWPANGYKISFYAHAPYGNENITLAPASTVGRMRYTYTVPTSVASHVDMMTAEVLDVTCPSTETVTLSFRHRLSDFKFLVENSTTEEVTVNSITIKNFKPTGTLIGDTWTPSGSVQDYSLSVGSNIASGARLDITGSNNHFMLIPQTLTTGKRLLDLHVTSGGVSTHFYSDLTEDFTAEPGKSYQFLLRLSSDLEVSQATSISEWVLYVGVLSYATGTQADDWDPESQPIERVISNGIAGWQQEN